MMQTVHKERYTVSFELPSSSGISDLRIEMFGDFISFGDCRREQFSPFVSLHMVYEGAGVMSVDAVDYPVRQGDVFVFMPGRHYRYGDDKTCPWKYTWVSLTTLRWQKLLARLGIALDSPLLPGAAVPLFPVLDRWRELILQQNANEFDHQKMLWELLTGLAQHRRDPESEARREALAVRARRHLELFLWEMPSVKELSSIFDVNRTTLNRSFHKEFNVGVHAYLERFRLQRACRMLRENDFAVETVARRCGYRTSRYFCTAFKRHFKQTPLQYRQSFIFAPDSIVK